LDTALEQPTPRRSNRRTFFRLVGFLRPYRVGLVLSIVLAAAAQTAQIAVIVLLGPVFGAIKAHNQHKLWVLIAIMLGIGLARALFMSARRFIAGNQALGVEYDLRMRIYSKLVRLSFSFFDRHQTGQLLSRATVDLTLVRFFLGYGLIFFAQHILTVLGATSVMLVLNPRLALVTIAVTPLVIAVAYRFSHITHPVLRDVQQKWADVATSAEENITGVHVVKAFAQEEAESARFSERNERLFSRSIDANRQQSFYIPLLGFIPLLAQAGVLLYGGWLVIHGQLVIGTFLSFAFLLNMLMFPLRQIGTWIGQAQRATAAGASPPRPRTPSRRPAMRRFHSFAPSAGGSSVATACSSRARWMPISPSAMAAITRALSRNLSLSSNSMKATLPARYPASLAW